MIEDGRDRRFDERRDRGGVNVKAEVGEVLVPLTRIARKLGVSPDAVRKALDRLIRLKRIERLSRGRYIVLSLLPDNKVSG